MLYKKEDKSQKLLILKNLRKGYFYSPNKMNF